MVLPLSKLSFIFLKGRKNVWMSLSSSTKWKKLDLNEKFLNEKYPKIIDFINGNNNDYDVKIHLQLYIY